MRGVPNSSSGNIGIVGIAVLESFLILAEKPNWNEKELVCRDEMPGIGSEADKCV